MEHAAGAPLGPPLELGPGPQQEPDGDGEAFRLDQALEAGADGPVSKVEGLAPHRLRARHEPQPRHRSGRNEGPVANDRRVFT